MFTYERRTGEKGVETEYEALKIIVKRKLEINLFSNEPDPWGLKNR